MKYDIELNSDYIYDNNLDGKQDGTDSFNLKYNGLSEYKQDIDEYRFMIAYSPAKLKIITLGLEYCHTKYDGTFSLIEGITTTYKGTTSSTNAEWYRGISQKSDDAIIHTTLKPSPILISAIGSGRLFFAPRLDVGAGYSFRSGHKKANTNDTLWITNADEMLGQDAWVFEGTATIGTYYNIGSSTILLDVGYRYKTDIDSRQRAGTDQKGVYGRLGYTYSW